MHKKIVVMTAMVVIIISTQWIWDKLLLVFLQDTKRDKWRKSLVSCTRDSFILHGMNSCHPWLNCRDIERDLIITDRQLGSGAEKVVVEGTWQGYSVAVNFLQHEDFFDDFQHNLAMLKLFSKEPGAQANKVVQLVGWCFENTPTIITELHPLGSADKVHAILKDQFQDFDSLTVRFKLCLEFVQILVILHTHPDGPRVLCDANDPQKALSQFLLTDNLTLVLSDMDALPLVDKVSGVLVKCGHRELHGDFVAPEQLWPYDNFSYSDDHMPHYDEKVDIWKVPDICNALIGDIASASKLQLLLFNIHSQCKDINPDGRPTAAEVMNVYESVYRKLKSAEMQNRK